MEYERMGTRLLQQGGGGGLSPSKLRAMFLGKGRRGGGGGGGEEADLHPSLCLRSVPPEADDCRDVGVVSSFPASAAGGLASEDENSGVDSESVSSSASVFEFQKSGPHRAPAPAPAPGRARLLAKPSPTPSKWDDADKWVRGPDAPPPGRHGAGMCRKSGAVVRPPGTRVVMEVNGKRNADGGVAAMKEEFGGADSGVVVEKSVAASTVSLTMHDSSSSLKSTATFTTPPSTGRSVSMRDMGTEMTPIASQEPSRTGTPTRSTTPIRSPRISPPSSPQRNLAGSISVQSSDSHGGDFNRKDLSEKELQIQTRREIMVLGAQLGKKNIAEWASKGHEEMDASISFKTLSSCQTGKGIVETRTAVFEEAEKARYLARFKREEIKIQAWENHQKAKTEAEMRKIEVEVEKMKARAHEKLLIKLASAHLKAGEKLAAAETKRNQQAARTAEQAAYIRETGRIPSSLCCWHWCC